MKSYYNLELENAQRRVRSQVTQAYFPVLLIKTNVNTLDNNIDNLEKLLRETEAQYEAGFVEKLDVDRLRLSINNLQSQRDQLEDQGANALRALKFTLNYPLDQPLAVDDDLESMERGIEQAALTGDIPYANRPETTAAGPNHRAARPQHRAPESRLSTHRLRQRLRSVPVPGE